MTSVESSVPVGRVHSQSGGGGAVVERNDSMERSISRLSTSSFVPSFDKDEFVTAGFDSDTFITRCRQHVGIQSLKNDLHSYLQALKKELVELINKDYADFVNLSANLVGMDKAIATIKDPLKGLRQDIVAVRDEVDEAMQALDAKLGERSLIREKKAFLQMFLNITDSVHKIEKLLKIGPHTGDTTVTRTDSAKDTNSITNDEGMQVVERVASEFNTLQFYVSQCRDLAYVKQSNKRIQVITETLLGSLESSFRAGLAAKDTAALEQCLRTYAMVDMAEKAEQLYSTVVVRPFVDKTLTSTRHQQEGLESLFAFVLSFVDTDCMLVRNITQQPGFRGFDFLANSVWPEVARAVSKNLAVIFSPGVPDTFYKNYMTTMQFVDSFELRLRTQACVSLLRASQSYVDFMKSWSLPVYFQLRFQEIASDLEDSLPVEMPVIDNPKIGEHGLVLAVSTRLWVNLQRVGQEGVFVSALAHRFWKLHLQLLARYATWLSDFKQHFPTTEADSSSKPQADGGALMANEKLPPSVFFLIYLAYDLQVLADKLHDMEAPVQEKLSKLAAISPTFVHDGLAEPIQAMMDYIPLISKAVVDVITSRCITNLKPVWRVTAAYRMTNKDMPSTPSSYAPEILRPLTTILTDQSVFIPKSTAREWSLYVAIQVAKRYAEITQEVLTTVEKTEASLLRLKKTRRTPKAPGAVLVGTDEDKIRRQLYLDAQFFGQEIERLGLHQEEVVDYGRLWECVKVGSQDAPPRDAEA
eukprot:comp6800_c0_seq1/m.2543 comp6800_c0_seq1/g.2543  ORF comp6800_c0_seq1/g.2543 comp6800_c0_seq1/m.2543 type:complete len:755 (-) comp6800_c0_seq1:317-2581(-)